MKESPYTRRRARSLLAVIFSLLAPILACGIPVPKPADICRNWATSSSYLLEGIGLSRSRYRVLFPYIYEPKQVFNQVPEDVDEVAVGGCGPRGSTVKVYRIRSLAPPLEEEALLGEVRVQADYTWRLENVTFSGREMIVAARAVTDGQTSGFSNRVVFFRAGSHGVSITDPPRGKEFLKKSIRVKGTGTPGARIILFVNDEERGKAWVNGKRIWEIGSVPLSMGKNRLRAEMEMAGERERLRSDEITVKRVGFGWPLDPEATQASCLCEPANPAHYKQPALDIIPCRWEFDDKTKTYGRCVPGDDVVKAVAPGNVEVCQRDADGEFYVDITHTVPFEGYRSRYLHLKKCEVETGDPVEKGARIGIVRCQTYRKDVCTRDHLHFELQEPDYTALNIQPCKLTCSREAGEWRLFDIDWSRIELTPGTQWRLLRDWEKVKNHMSLPAACKEYKSQQ